MPLYEYLCEACGRRTEVLQSFGDPPLAACPHCGGAVKKQFSAPAFHLKGSGWYATDYAKKSGVSSKPAAADKSETAPAAEKASEAKAGDAKASDTKSSTEKPAAAPASSGGGDTKS